MPREPNPKIEQAKKLFRQGKKLVEIAEQLEVPEGTVRSWKNRYRWNIENSATLQKDKPKQRNVAKGKSPPKSDNLEKVLVEIEELYSSELTDKQKLFCIYYTKYFNATKAALKAGYSQDTAYSIGHNLLKKVEVREEIQTLKQGKLNRAMLSENDIFQKMIDIAFADITDYLEFGKKDIVIDTKEDGEPVMVKINYVDFKGSTEVDGSIISEVKQGKDGVSLKLHDKMKALQWLADRMDLLTTLEQRKLELEQQKVTIAKAKADSPEDEEVEDDGFIDALEGKVGEIWAD